LIANHLNKLANGDLHPCPYIPGHYAHGNISTDIKNYRFMSKGSYKYKIFVRTDEDPDGVNATAIVSFLIRGGEELAG
jgi:hypothetical protein